MRKNSHSPSFDVSLEKKSGLVNTRLVESRGLQHAWPCVSTFAGNDSDMMRAFFHLASQVYGGGYDQVRICASDLDL